MALFGDQEPLAWFARAAEAKSGSAWVQDFEFMSRGDRVPGRLLTPATHTRPAPLLLVAHAQPATMPPALLPLAGALPSRGVAVAQLDLALHGSRAEHKLAASVEAGFCGRGPAAPLALEFVRQALMDLSRCLDALSAHAEIDTQRVAFAGAGLAADVGARFCAEDGRARAAILALAGRPSECAEIDPAGWVGKISPRPLLLVNARSDTRVPSAAQERLYDAAGEPRARHCIDVATDIDSQASQDLMWSFLRDALGL